MTERTGQSQYYQGRGVGKARVSPFNLVEVAYIQDVQTGPVSGAIYGFGRGEGNGHSEGNGNKYNSSYS